MDHTATLERAPEEVSAPPTASHRSSRFTGIAVLAAIAAAVLGISALGGAEAARSTVADLASNGAASGSAGAQQAAPPDQPAEAQPGMPGHGAGQQAPPGAAEAGSQQAPVEHQVTMKGKVFTPAALTVAVGDTVTWVNDDDALHTVSVTDGPETFQSDLMEAGQTFSYTFTSPGTYNYLCDVHPDMVGSVIVTGAAAPPVDGAAPGDGGQVPVDDTVGCVPSTAFDVLMGHIEAAHLQSSPGQQVKDLADLDQYVKTHTVLVQNMLQPVFDGVVTDGGAASMDALRRHIETAHLQTSPGQQAADLLALDEYVKTHTVLVQNTAAPNEDYLVC